MRYEKGINPALTKYALELATKLFIELAGGKVRKNPSYFDNEDYSPKEVSVTLEKINHNLGREYTLEDVRRIFTGLSFEFEEKNGEFKVLIPRRRPDIFGYQDLIEEVVRIDGLSKIEASIPPSVECGRLTPYQAFVRKIRHTLAHNLNETLTYSLVNAEEATDFDNKEIPVVKLLNPLSDDREYMKHSNIPQLLKTIRYNNNRMMNDSFLFEIGRSYTKEKDEPILSIALSGLISSTLWKGEKEPVDFFYLKGLVEDLFDKLSIKNYSIDLPSSPRKGLHPGISASIYLGREEVGFMGKIHPLYEKKYEVKNVFVFEMPLEKLFEYSHELKSVKEISKYPSISRDLALVMDENLPQAKLMEAIKRASKKNLIDYKVFDLYKGEGIPKGMKQIAVSLTFADNTRTLEAQEVDQIIKEILNKLSSIGVNLRQ